jgi:hypothetical protein
MQTFKDSLTNEIWQFEDDVTDIHAFPNTLATLQPYTIPAPTAAQLLAAAQQTQLALMDSSYRSAIQQPVAYMNTTFQADASSQDVLTKCLVAGSVPAGFYWLDANNAQVIMTFAQLQGLAGAMLVQGNAAFAHLQAKKSAIKAVTTTVADVQAIVW